jgi:four helix bundle protein
VEEEQVFRFQKLMIWQRAAEIAIQLDEFAGQLEERRKYRFAEQLRAAGLSISNNIAEGSGSNSAPDFRRFLFIARKSAFECASMLLVFKRRDYLDGHFADQLVTELEAICKMIVSFSRTLKD